VKVNDLLD